MKRPRFASLASVVCVIPLLGWWMYGLFDLDEGFYAAVVAEMNRRGEWITPYFNGQPWFEKPVLLYWIAKPCLFVFGGEFGIRLPSILASLATYALIAWFGKRRLGPNSGIVAALVLATSLFFVAIGRMVLVDPILIACLTGAFLTFWESLVGDPRWRIASAVCLGLAVLAKGPVAIVLFVAVIAYTFWRERELRPAFRGYWMVGTLVLALVVAAWYLPAYLDNGQVFVQKFLIEQNLQRFKGGDEAHAVPMPWGLVYYLPVVLVGMIPWSLFIPRAWPRKGAEGKDAPVKRYLATWAVVVFAFFTVSGTKLPHYVLPCFPALALLVGHDLATRWKGLGSTRTNYFAVAAVGLAAFLTFGFKAYYEAANMGPKQIAWRINHGQGIHDESVLNPKSIVILRLGKQDTGLYPPLPKPLLFGRWPLGVNETSLPSTLFYLDPWFRSQRWIYSRDPVILETNSFSDLTSVDLPMVIITRPGRITSAERPKLPELHIGTNHVHGLAIYPLYVATGPLVEADWLEVSDYQTIVPAGSSPLDRRK